MPDTAVIRTAQGWIDRDNPQQHFRVRREAREARRAAKGGRQRPQFTQQQSTVTTGVITGYANGIVVSNVQTMSSLQTRLYNRMVNQQGVSHDEAVEVIDGWGYNKAASYGHMRAAGANHHEASIVVNLNNPTISLSYGLGREAGLSHIDALSGALNDGDPDHTIY